MTRQQIAEKIKDILQTELNVDYNFKGQVYVDGINEATKEISDFIHARDKEVWDQACEAFRFKAIEAITMINPRFEHEIGAVTDLELPPYPEK